MIQAAGRLGVTVDGSSVTIVVGPSRHRFLLVYVWAWEVSLLGLATFTFIRMPWAKVSPLLSFAVALFVAAMLGCGASMLRWIQKGEQRLEVSPGELVLTRTFQPFRNGQKRLRNSGSFTIGAPLTNSRPLVQYGAWNMGPLYVAHLEGKRKVVLINRLTRDEARLAAEALRSAGYAVSNLELIA